MKALLLLLIKFGLSFCIVSVPVIQHYQSFSHMILVVKSFGERTESHFWEFPVGELWNSCVLSLVKWSCLSIWNTWPVATTTSSQRWCQAELGLSNDQGCELLGVGIRYRTTGGSRPLEKAWSLNTDYYRFAVRATPHTSCWVALHP